MWSWPEFYSLLSEWQALLFSEKREIMSKLSLTSVKTAEFAILNVAKEFATFWLFFEAELFENLLISINAVQRQIAE